MLLLALVASAAGAAPLTIHAAPPPSSSTVHYKAFSDSWVVQLPEGIGLYATDLLVPQVCSRRDSCASLNFAAQVGNCSLVTSLLSYPAWTNSRLQPYMEGEGVNHPALCSLLEQQDRRRELQADVQDVCIQPCAHVLQPLGIEILGQALDTLRLYDLEHSATHMRLRMRITVVTVLGRESQDQPDTMFAVSAHVFEVHLERPGLTGLTVNLQHECSRRGLVAPALATMDLFLDSSGALVCNWNCKPDHLRTQWNLPPLEKNSSEEGEVKHMCWRLPDRFVAVVFSLHVGTQVRAPYAALLPSTFYEGINALADSMGESHFGGGKVLLNVPGSSFDTSSFEFLLDQAVRFRGDEDKYEVVRLGQLEPMTSKTSARRLLQQGSAQGVLDVKGVAINPLETFTPQHYVKELDRAVQRARASLPSSLLDVGSVRVQELHRVATRRAPVAPQTANETEDPHERVRRTAAMGLEVIIMLAISFLLCIWFFGTRRRRRTHEERSSDEP